MQTVRLIFVCLGNICRSPAAMGIMKKKIEEAGLSSLAEVDSAGTIAYHAGEQPDNRMIRHAAATGYEITHTARKFNPHEDFDKNNYILAMDGENYNHLLTMDINRKYRHKIFMITDFCQNIKAAEVPDPYYGGDEGFIEVLNILEDACSGLLERVKSDLRNSKK